ncbi:MAG TPA: tetratricopeptide repeat protein [Acetobacteraceae bacterium]|nr:tetratricopeptide repeat protein [Acetobacteraceae bacterium]
MQSIEAILLAGIARQQAGRLDEAETAYRDALRLHGPHPRALFLTGLVCLRTERADEAASLFRQALARAPDHAGAAVNLPRALLATGRFAAAHDAAASACARFPEIAELHFLRGTALNGLGRPAAATGAFALALALDPRHAPSWLNLGNALADLDRLEEAERHIREAIRLDPHLLEARASLGFVLTSLGRLDEARAACAAAIAQDPDFPEAHWNLATAALLQGDYATGFREYEWRKRHDRFRRDFIDLPGPRWGGGPLQGRRLVIQAEQGLGDTIQLSRYASILAGLGARVMLACDRSLIRLLATCPGIERAVDRTAELPDYDCWVDQMSLPGLLGTAPGTIPFAQGWLRADPAALARIGAMLPPGRRAGLVWAGNPLHSNDRRRSLPERFLPQLVEAGRQAGLTWISLQQGKRASEATRCGLHDAAASCTDFADTAAALANVELLVSVDTSVAHLAGALGVPALVMLPFAPDWRWLLGRDDTPWYASLRLFRQPAPGDWNAVIAAVGRALRSRCGA